MRVIRKITDKIVNPGPEDYHCHSKELSDGLDTSISELVKRAGKKGMKELAITDHSQASLDTFDRKPPKGRYFVANGRWGNVYNDVNVIFGIESDLLNQEGDICDYTSDALNASRRYTSNFLILSAHSVVYKGNPAEKTDAYRRAIQRHHSKINFLGHPSSNDFADGLDMKKLIAAANEYGVAMEFNCANLMNKRTNLKHLHLMLQGADRIYVNSDAHTLWEFETLRDKGFQFLKEQSYM